MRFDVTSLTAAIVAISCSASIADAEVWDKLSIHGTLSQGYMKSSANNWITNSEDGDFEFNELGINFNYEINDQLHVGIQFFARDQGDYFNHDINVDWAYGDYHPVEWFGVRMGKIKSPLGLYNEVRDIDAVRTSLLLPQSVYSDGWRDVIVALEGVGVYGDVSLGAGGSLEYQAQAGSVNINEDSFMFALVDSLGAFTTTEIDIKSLYTAQLLWNTPLEGLRLGGSTAVGDFDIHGDTVDALVPIFGPDYLLHSANWTRAIWSLEYTRGGFMIAGERSTTKYDTIQNGMLFPVVTPRARDSASELDWYVQSSYRLTDWFVLGAYYSASYGNTDDKEGKGDGTGDQDFGAFLKDWALSLRFDINEHWIIKLEAHDMHGYLGLLPSDNPDGLDRNWNVYAARASFTF